MVSKVAIVHESEVQRQHIRLQLPIKVSIGDFTLDTDDWSSSGVALTWDGSDEDAFASSVAVGHIVDANLLFRFEGFDLSMPMKLELRYIERSKQRAGFRFTNVNERQLSLLQYVVGAYVSGEVVRAGDIIQIVGRNNQLQSRSIPSDKAGLNASQLFKMKMRKLFYSSLVVAASVAAVAYIVMGMYERSFVVVASSGEVMADASTVVSTASGKALFPPKLLDSKVKKGQPLVSIQTEKGNTVSVDSPCDCIVKELLVANHGDVSTGDELVTLTSVDAEPYVEARVPADQAVRLATDNLAVLNFTGMHQTIAGKITRIKVGESSSQAVVTIAPVDALPVTWVDDPVDVRFDTLLFSK